MSVMRLTSEEGGKLLAGKRIAKEILLQRNDGEQVKVQVYIVARNRTEEEKRRSRVTAALSHERLQKKTVQNLELEGIPSQTPRRWTEEEKQELRDRLSRGESNEQIAIAMKRTYGSVLGAIFRERGGGASGVRAQRESLENLGRQETEGRVHKSWTEDDKRELRIRISRGETNKQIALAMKRTYKSVRGAREKSWARES